MINNIFLLYRNSTWIIYDTKLKKKNIWFENGIIDWHYRQFDSFIYLSSYYIVYFWLVVILKYKILEGYDSIE